MPDNARAIRAEYAKRRADLRAIGLPLQQVAGRCAIAAIHPRGVLDRYFSSATAKGGRR